MHTNLLILLKSLKTNLESALHNLFGVVSLIFCFFLLGLFVPLILKVFLYFFPLLFSTLICFTAVYLLMLSEKQAGRIIELIKGETEEHRLVQVHDNGKFSLHHDHVEVSCYLLEKSKSEWGEDGSEDDDDGIILAEKPNLVVRMLETVKSNGVFSENDASSEIDSLAEGVWNCYFGRYSKWHYKGVMFKEDVA